MKTVEEKREYNRNYQRRYREEHPEKSVSYRKASKDKIAKRTREWRKKNPTYQRDWQRDHKEQVSVNRKRRREENGDVIRKIAAVYGKQWSRKNLANVLVSSAKRRAKKSGIPFAITKDDISIPERCPILGIPLIQNEGFGPCDNSPSLDRIVPAKGYVPDNIAVISVRANRIKNEGTIEEHRKIVSWLESQLTT